MEHPGIVQPDQAWHAFGHMIRQCVGHIAPSLIIMAIIFVLLVALGCQVGKSSGSARQTRTDI